MTVLKFPSQVAKSKPADMMCWRVSAIYRCCIRLGMSKDWAKMKLREISPEGHRDHMADVWFTDMENIRARYASQKQSLMLKAA